MVRAYRERILHIDYATEDPHKESDFNLLQLGTHLREMGYKSDIDLGGPRKPKLKVTKDGSSAVIYYGKNGWTLKGSEEFVGKIYRQLRRRAVITK